MTRSALQRGKPEFQHSTEGGKTEARVGEPGLSRPRGTTPGRPRTSAVLPPQRLRTPARPGFCPRSTIRGIRFSLHTLATRAKQSNSQRVKPAAIVLLWDGSGGQGLQGWEARCTKKRVWSPLTPPK